MRILVIIPTLGYGGAERLLVTLLPKLKKKGCYIKVCTLSTPLDLADELKSYQIDVINLSLKHRWSILEAIRKLYKEIKKFQPNIIWGHLYFGILYSRLVSIFVINLKVVSVLHYNISSDSTKKGLWYSFRNWIFDKSQKIDFATIAVSKSTKKDYEDFFHWKNINVIYNAIDTKSIDKAIEDKLGIREKYKILSSNYVIIIPGRLHESKGHKYLIEAIYQLKIKYNLAPKVIIVGGGHLKNEITKQINRLGLNQQFVLTGNLEQKELFTIIKVSDIVVIPSLFEAFGIAAIEAMYLEKPTITTNVDGLKEITTNDVDTIQVKIKDVLAITNALVLLINDKIVAKKLAKNAKQTALKYDINNIVNQWIKVFEGEKI